MRRFSRLASVAVLVAWCAARCIAAEPKPSLDSVLANWETATAKIKTLDAKVYRWKYDDVFSLPNKEIKPDEGRFYFETPGIGCLQIQAQDRAGWHGLSEMVVWSEEDTLVIDGIQHDCKKIVWQDPATGGQLDGLLWAFFRAAEHPQTILPFVVEVRAAKIRKEFKLSMEDKGDQFLITAISTSKTKPSPVFSRIEVHVDAKTYLTTGVQCLSAGGHDRLVWRLDDMKINERPRDRDQLLSPELTGIKMSEGKLPRSGS
jgi:hypothetical protein